MDDQEYFVYVEEAAKLLGHSPIPREFISEALRRIRQGNMTVEYYPASAYPLIREVLTAARRLERARAIHEGC